ncbi:hypothetical protein N0V84_003075 [Fusarium piperis]|uniref:Uncharacterized protein n=1 Tax=Fusarium piperis TaxID=1435070 RepID=A0A9W9BRS1_9HYPO|nr:hypothetical protein N0V84_003075 [Fusarium piperis]
MSGTRPGQGNPSAGSFSQFRLAVPEKPPRNHQSTWNGLAQSAPRNEADWEARRRQHGFDSPEYILDTLTQLSDLKEKSNLGTIVFLARCKVDSYRTGTKPYSTVRGFFNNDKLTEVSIETYLRTVVNFIRLLDEIYLSGLRHRAFELPLYVPSKVAHLRQYVERPSTFKSYFSVPTPGPEIQGSLFPCIQFLVGLQLPDDYDLICKALRTRLFPKQEFDSFLSAFQRGKLVARIPPLPTFTPPLPIVQHFKVFGLSGRLQKKTLESADQLRGHNPAWPAVSSEVNLYAYEWAAKHQAVVDETIHRLVRLPGSFRSPANSLDLAGVDCGRRILPEDHACNSPRVWFT